MSCYCDFEAPAFYLKTIRKARKHHKCSECYRIIQIGEQYESVSAKWDSMIDTFKTCKNCTDLRDYTKSNVPCLCWTHGNLLEDCIETLREYSHELPGMLFGGLRFIAISRILKKCKS